jgi:hypothetical protein
MLFDHDPELGATLYLDHTKKEIRGVFYRWDEAKQMHVMDVKGAWIKVETCDNPFLRMLPGMLYEAATFIGERDKLPWLIACDWLEERVFAYVKGGDDYDKEAEFVKQTLNATRAAFDLTQADGGLQKYLDLLDTYTYITE